MMYNLTEKQHHECQEFEQLSNLKQFDIDTLYRTIFVGTDAGTGYDLLAECTGIDGDKITFNLIHCINQGAIEDKDLPGTWSINNLEYITVFKIGLLEDFPEYRL